MLGINLDKPISYIGASLRFFEPKEHYVTRFCREDVLLMVYDGTLRFTEDNVPYEILPGKYFIHKHDTYQSGIVPSDEPKYLYVHFNSHWAEEGSVLPRSGDFDYVSLRPLMEKLDRAAHANTTFTEKSALFLEILTQLYRKNEVTTTAGKIADYLSLHSSESISLELLSKEFHFSKNQIINIFKKQYRMTPFEYMANIRIRQAQHLLTVTGKTAQNIALECGFNDYTAFYKLFIKSTGLSPAEWRRSENFPKASRLIQ